MYVHTSMTDYHCDGITVDIVDVSFYQYTLQSSSIEIMYRV